MSHSQERYAWLLKNYATLDRETRNKIISMYQEISGGHTDSDAFYDAMMALGIKLPDDDPCPPILIPLTESGALEYEDAMAAAELMSGEA